jgi:hypothetical protein
VVGVDGRSGGGKSTLAAKLHVAVSASAVIHTDHIAWHHSRFGWSELLARSVLQPIRNGQSVGYRPPGWESHGRTGAIEVPRGLDLVIIEGSTELCNTPGITSSRTSTRRKAATKYHESYPSLAALDTRAVINSPPPVKQHRRSATMRE